MKLSQKTFLYSFILGLITLLFFTGYIIWMLPQLYVDRMEKRILDSARAIHLNFVKNGRYKEETPLNPENAISFVLSKDGSSIEIAGMGYSGTVVIRNENLKNILLELVNWMDDHPEKRDSLPDIAPRLEALFKDIGGDFADIHIRSDDDFFRNRFKSLGTNFEAFDSSTFFFSSKSVSGTVYYTNFIGITNQSNQLILTAVSALNPSIDQIRPVTLTSLPMIIAVLLLITLLSSAIYARTIVLPVEKIARRSNEIDFAYPPEKQTLIVEGKDEIAQLSRSLDDLHLRLWQQYETLQREHERQEIVLRASSHQLKTPLAGALGLLDGMIGKVGKFSDSEKYLPEVRTKLLIIQKMVEDLLNQTRKADDGVKCVVSLHDFVNTALQNQAIEMTARDIRSELFGELKVYSYPDQIEIIIDNLISNAVRHSPDGARITIKLEDNRLLVHSSGSSLPDGLTAHAFEPFVTGETETSGHGLGLYLANAAAKTAGVMLRLYNDQDGVTAAVEFPAELVCTK